MVKLLITGASGYIGRNFIKNYTENYDFSCVSLRETDIKDIDFTGIESILHLSALVHQKESRSRDEYFRVNYIQTIGLARAAKANGVRHFIFFSTVAVYGLNGYIEGEEAYVLTEDSKCEPVEPYGESKLRAEIDLLKLEDENFMVSIIRPPMVYGPACPGNMARLLNIIDKIPLLPFDFSSNGRSMIFIDNLICFTHLVILNKVDGITIPQDKEVFSIKKIVSILSKGCNRKNILFRFPRMLFRYLYARHRRVMCSLYGSLIFETSRSNHRTGFVAPYSAEQGLYLMSSAGRSKSKASDIS